jgi:hypothetical protein
MSETGDDFAEFVRCELVPKIAASAYVISIAPSPEEADVKAAVELGLAILLDKPVIVFKPHGRIVAERLLRIADHVIEGDISTETGRQAAYDKLCAILAQ